MHALSLQFASPEIEEDMASAKVAAVSAAVMVAVGGLAWAGLPAAKKME